MRDQRARPQSHERKGLPGFRFVQDGSDYFDLHHTPDDTLDKIDPAAMDQNVAAYLVFVWMAANSNVSDWGGLWSSRFCATDGFAQLIRSVEPKAKKRVSTVCL